MEDLITKVLTKDLFKKIRNSIHEQTMAPSEQIKVEDCFNENTASWENPVQVTIRFKDGDSAQALCDMAEDSDYEEQITFLVEQLEDCFTPNDVRHR